MWAASQKMLLISTQNSRIKKKIIWKIKIKIKRYKMDSLANRSETTELAVPRQKLSNKF